MKKIIVIYFLNLIAWILFIIIKFFDTDFINVLKTVFTSTQGLIIIHAFFIIELLFMFYWVKHIQIFKNKGIKSLFKFWLKYSVFPLILIISILSCIYYYNNSEVFNPKVSDNYNKQLTANNNFQKDSKIRGVSAFGLRGNKIKIQKIVKYNVEWVALHPFLYQNNEYDNKLFFDKKLLNAKDSAFSVTIKELKNKNIKTMLKPHLWLSKGWRNNIDIKEDTKWKNWFESYSKIVLFYAKMAERNKVELFCIGTELDKTIINHSEDWIKLIKKIKTIYKGKLTYAMNWDSDFFNPDFWGELDYIGIQAYYPLTTNKNPDLAEIKNGWKEYINQLEKISIQISKPILFTEIGYRNDVSATIKPWEWSNWFQQFFTKKSDKTQYYAYQAFFEEVWKQTWFKGAFIWQWNKYSDFSIINTPAQNLLMSEFSKEYSK